MATSMLVIVTVFLSLLAWPSRAAELRQWQDESGEFRITASFKEIDAQGEVVLELEDGTTRKVLPARLSAKDRAYLKGLTAASTGESDEPSVERQATPEAHASPGAKVPKKKSETMPEATDLTEEEKWEKWAWNALLGGLILFGVGSLIALIDSFAESLWWGLACFLIPPVQFFYIATHWHRAYAARGGMLMIVGIGLVAGVIVSGMRLEGGFDGLKERWDERGEAPADAE